MSTPANNQLIFTLRLLRREFRRMHQRLRYRRFSLRGVPVIFANSFPKSGTHLLTQVLQGFTRIGPAVNSGLPAIVNYNGFTGQLRSLDVILADLHRLKSGDIAYGHLHAVEPVIDVLSGDGFASFFILRDPRDVVISHVHYLTEMASDHVHHAYFKEKLSTFDERLYTSICGLESGTFKDVEQAFPSIAARFEPFLDWLGKPEILILHYEDFIQSREDTLRKVLAHTIQRGFPSYLSSQVALKELEAFINPAGSPTFRRGKIGGWRDEFNLDAKRVFKEIAGDLLIRLNYEKDYDW